MSKQKNSPPRERTLAQEMLVPILVFAGAIVIAGLVLLFGDKITGAGGGRAAAEKRISAETLANFQGEYDNLGQSVGPADAKVVVREFADYQCPACGAFETTAEKIRKNFAETGKIRFVFFDFPLPMHAHSHQAAEAAHCAARQHAFWNYHDALYAHQRQWAASDDATSNFLDIAVETGAKYQPFKQCLESHATRAGVEKSAALARKIGVNATPTVLVGRRVFSGVKSYDSIANEIRNQRAAVSAGQNSGS